MSKVYYKDILRSAGKGWKRFLSIVIITALGVAMLTGLYAGCMDMYASADQFFDRQNLFDIRVLSTLGLTEEDVKALAKVEGVGSAEGSYSKSVRTQVGDARKSAEMTVLSAGGLNCPYLLSGTLPAKKGEIAVTQEYLEESGKTIGDTLTIEEDLDASDEMTEDAQADISEADSTADSDLDVDTEIDLEEEETPAFANTSYVITGAVTDPKDIQSNGITSIFRSAAASDYTFFITDADAEHDLFTVVYITLDGTEELNSFSDEYESAVQTVVQRIESRIKEQREQARYDAVFVEARSKIQDAETTMNEKFAEADEKFTDAWNEMTDAGQELAEGEATLAGEETDAKRKIAEARADLESGRQELADAEKQLTAGEAELTDGERQLAEGEAELNANTQKLEDGKQQLAEELRQAEAQLADAERQLNEAQSRLDESRIQLEAGITQLKSTLGSGWPADEWNALTAATASLAATGADDSAIAAGTAGESALLAHALQEQTDGMNAALAQQISQSKAALDMVNLAITALDQQLDAAGRQAADAQAGLDEKIALADTAQAVLDTETETLNGLEEDTPEYNAQLAVVAAARNSLDAANEAAAAAQDTLETANAAVSHLTEEYGAKTAEAAQLEGAIEQMNQQAAQLSVLPESGVQTALGIGKVNGGQQMLDAQKDDFAVQKAAALQQLAEAEAASADGEAQINIARRTMEEKKSELEAGKAALAQGRAELETGKAELADGEATLDAEEADARKQIADAWAEITEGKQELADGKAELTEQEQEYAEKKEDAAQKLADAYSELDDLDMTQWYVQDRTSLESYSSLDSDLSSIEAVGRVFPVLFLLVAVLMSLTTMTRMVEEERGLIGLYKALGYDSKTIYSKYILFALTASLLGGVVGDILGFVFMPSFISVILKELYSVPYYNLRFDTLYGVGGVLLFVLAIVGSTMLACRNELSHTPAALMRPKAPRAGARVLLERVPFIWNHLKFLNKVTVRNLFRYKKRLLMTIGGIMGCTALILCGFAIKDSIADLAPKQYQKIYQYDLMAVFEEKENDALVKELAADSNIEAYLNLRIDNVKLVNAAGKSEKVQFLVIPSGASLDGYLHLENRDGTPARLDDSGVLITQNAARILGFKSGDTVSIQDTELAQHDAVLSGVVENYLGNTVYMTQGLYETLFGTYIPNGVLAQLSDTCADPRAYAESLLDKDSVLSSVSTAALQEDFSFDLIDAVVLLLIVMAGGLAFVVLFTLSNTNISERARELATIKVLGFYDNEVHQYVNKETLLLTGIGILVGLPVGRVLSGLLTIALNMPSIHFAVHVEPFSYLISALIAFCFAVAVNWITNRTLNRINMVEALKSVE